MRTNVKTRWLPIDLERIDGEWCEDREPLPNGPLDRLIDVERLHVELEFEIITRSVAASWIDPPDDDLEIVGKAFSSTPLTELQKRWLVNHFSRRMTS